jgi:CMP/dCMP kinase
MTSTRKTSARPKTASRKRRGSGFVVAIDGPAGAGKSTVSKRVAERLGLDRLDTGSMYRALTWKALEAGIDPTDGPALARLARRIDLGFTGSGITVDGRRREREIRAPRVSAAVSAVSSHPGVRKEMVSRQRRFAERGGVVIEGRDIGSVVAPDADVKVFLTASPAERARRRRADLVAAGHAVSLRKLTSEIAARDRRDSRTTPLRPARGAVKVDSTGRTLRAVVDEIVRLARNARAER